MQIFHHSIFCEYIVNPQIDCFVKSISNHVVLWIGWNHICNPHHDRLRLVKPALKELLQPGEAELLEDSSLVEALGPEPYVQMAPGSAPRLTARRRLFRARRAVNIHWHGHGMICSFRRSLNPRKG